MKKRSIAAVVAFCLVFAVHAFSQSSNGSPGGIVQDPSGALVPGVTITLTNTATGIVNTTISNESGAYSIPSVTPGTYKITAALPGFRTSAFSDVGVGNSAQVRLDFKMQLGETAASTVEVSVGAQQLLTESSATIGTVLAQSTVRDLPLIGGDVLSLSKTFRISENNSMQIRVDATNVLNHADPGTPTLTLSDAFGNIAAKGTQVRNFQGQLRLSF